jgi:hypothetical protein
MSDWIESVYWVVSLTHMQWAAVKTWVGLIKDPPQPNWEYASVSGSYSIIATYSMINVKWHLDYSYLNWPMGVMALYSLLDYGQLTM